MIPTRGGFTPAALAITTIVLFSALGIAQNQPQIPPPPGLSPPTPTQQQPQQQPQLQPQGGATTIVPSPTPRVRNSSGGPTLDACGGAISRMMGLFLLELIIEFFFSIFRFLVLSGRLEWDLQKFALFRLAWTFFPVIPFNFSALWWGTGPKGSCLSNFGAVRVIFTVLLFYTMYSALDAVLLIIHSRDDDSEYDSYDYGSEYSRRNWRRRRRRNDSDSVTGTASADETEPKLIDKIMFWRS